VFTPSRLTLARMRRGITKSQLARLVGLSVRSISAFESGEMEPSAKTLSEIAASLRFPTSFFSRGPVDRPPVTSASFRALTSMTAAQRNAAVAAGALAIELNEWLESRFNLPTPNIPTLRGASPEAAAEAIREHWQLGQRPIRNVIHLLEQHGVRVFSLAQECRQVDAFSLWRAGTPLVFLNTVKSAERSRFDAAHELGHLALHRHGGPHCRGRDAERESDVFASAFLMPRASVLAVAPRFATLDALLKLKKQWNVSVAALVHRLHAVGLLTEWHYRTLMVEISTRGYRTTEPETTERETSQILTKMFASLRARGVTRATLASELCVQSADIDALVFGLSFVSLPGGRDHEKTNELRSREHPRIGRK
jgi:Zn-dependent peptidase ImmA (M78 family)/DNA-binding XRE family transcriptional regulator